MLSKETLEEYRRMTPTQRLALTIQSMEEMARALLSGTELKVDRKFELLRREHNSRNKNKSTAIAKSQVLAESKLEE
jgi:PBP1b-binding outer membrane lipoprotein LpoB